MLGWTHRPRYREWPTGWSCWRELWPFVLRLVWNT